MSQIRQERENDISLSTNFTNRIDDSSGKKILVARGKLIGNLKDRSLPESFQWRRKVSEVQICSRDRQMTATGFSSASCYLHSRDLRRPITCFQPPLPMMSDRPSGKVDQGGSASYLVRSRGSNKQGDGGKQSNVLPMVRSATVQSLPSSVLQWNGKNRETRFAKHVSLSQLHKLITTGGSSDDVVKDKPRVRISIQRTDNEEGTRSPSGPKVQVVILNKQKSTVPSLPETVSRSSQKLDLQRLDERNSLISQNYKPKLLYDEWQFIPNFNQTKLLNQLDPPSIRAMERTRAWIWSIPLEGTEDSNDNIEFRDT